MNFENFVSRDARGREERKVSSEEQMEKNLQERRVLAIGPL